MNPQTAAYVIAISFIALSESKIRGKGSRSFRTASQRLDRTTMAYVASIVCILLSAPLLSRLNLFSIHSQVAGWLGVGILLLGVAVRTIAMKTLGDYYTRALITAKGQQVVTGGLYRYVRHPGYTGTILGGIGFGLAQLNYLTLFVTVLLLTLVYVKRIPAEEALLTADLGSAYRDYAKKTKRLVPFVY